MYNHLVPILDVNMWPSDDRSMINYGDEVINDLTALWKELLKNNGCATTNIPAQWDMLKNRVYPMLSGNTQLKYLEAYLILVCNDNQFVQ